MILNKTRKHSERYQIINEGMGGAGQDRSHYLNKYSVVSGKDNGRGYQQYMSVDYFLSNDGGYIPQEAIDNCKKFLRDRGYQI